LRGSRSISKPICRKDTKKSTQKETRRALEHDAKPLWQQRHIDEIARRDVIDLLDTIADRGAAVQANRMFAVLRCLSTGVSSAIIATSLVAGLKMPTAETARDRARSDDAIRLFWIGCDKLG
jgi:hypothetical protein